MKQSAKLLVLTSVFLLLVAGILTACDKAEKETIIVNDQKVDVIKTSFKIACDTDKRLGIALWGSLYDDGAPSKYSVGGMLSDKQYEIFCGGLK